MYQIQQVPRLPLGQRRLLQRLPDPQHRRMLLDEGRLAGHGQGLRRPAAIAATTSTRTSTPTRSNTPSPTAPSCSSKAGTSTAATRSSPATPTAPRARPSSRPTRTARPGAASTRGRSSARSDVVWAFPQPEPNPYQVEWDDLIHAIRKDKLYNEVKRGAEASLVTSMGRMAAHTGQVITFDDMLNCKYEFAPDVDKLTMTSPAPLQIDKLTKRYPIPAAGHRQGPRVPGLMIAAYDRRNGLQPVSEMPRPNV